MAAGNKLTVTGLGKWFKGHTRPHLLLTLFSCLPCSALLVNELRRLLSGRRKRKKEEEKKYPKQETTNWSRSVGRSAVVSQKKGRWAHKRGQERKKRCSQKPPPQPPRWISQCQGVHPSVGRSVGRMRAEKKKKKKTCFFFLSFLRVCDSSSDCCPLLHPELLSKRNNRRRLPQQQQQQQHTVAVLVGV